MKSALKLTLFILIGILSMSSCSKDDSTCSREDWTGSYTGTLQCPDNDPINVEFQIVAGTLDGNIRFVEPGKNELPLIDFKISGCDVTNSRYNMNWLGGPVETIWSGSISGNQLSVDIDVNLLGVCTIRASK